jgi:hypothetical protein
LRASRKMTGCWVRAIIELVCDEYEIYAVLVLGVAALPTSP